MLSHQQDLGRPFGPGCGLQLRSWNIPSLTDYPGLSTRCIATIQVPTCGSPFRGLSAAVRDRVGMIDQLALAICEYFTMYESLHRTWTL